MKIIDSKECKIYEFGYSADGGSIKLISSIKTDRDENLSLSFSNGTGDGDYKYYIINCVGWGPYFYSDNESYEEYKKFENRYENKNGTRLVWLHQNVWKVMDYDISKNYNDDGVELFSSIDFISVFSAGDEFYFYCYQKDIDYVESYDKYLSNIENVEEAEKVMRGKTNMAEFKVNRELFGCYAHIKTYRSDNIFLYKVIGVFESNHYVKVPVKYPYEEITDTQIIPVANVICCGIDETKVRRIPLKEVEDIVSNDLKTILYTGKDFEGKTLSEVINVRKI